MTWTKLDDSFYSNPKVLATWDSCPAAVGLHALALSHCARHLTDGEVRFAFASQLFTSRRALDRALEALVQHGLWSPAVHAWQIHDYLAYNPSRAEKMAERERERQKRRKQRSVRDLTVSPGDTGYGLKNPRSPHRKTTAQFDASDDLASSHRALADRVQQVVPELFERHGPLLVGAASVLSPSRLSDEELGRALKARAAQRWPS